MYSLWKPGLFDQSRMISGQQRRAQSNSGVRSRVGERTTPTRGSTLTSATRPGQYSLLSDSDESCRCVHTPRAPGLSIRGMTVE